MESHYLYTTKHYLDQWAKDENEKTASKKMMLKKEEELMHKALFRCTEYFFFSFVLLLPLKIFVLSIIKDLLINYECLLNKPA